DSTLEAFLNGKKAADNIADSALNNIDENILGKLNNEYQEHMFRISIKNAVKNIIKDLKTK
ncbi:MAG: hypothetical protein KKF78_08700, partial [Candidatus Omnitrophica bacterium]|nr:hypothetical protein [Candidatus Omnitrophota bacterium]